jgi:hypothetical protein
VLLRTAIVDLRLVKAILDPLPLDPGLDFIVLDNGAIELTETGFRRMVQAHSAGLDVVIVVDERAGSREPWTGGCSFVGESHRSSARMIFPVSQLDFVNRAKFTAPKPTLCCTVLTGTLNSAA